MPQVNKVVITGRLGADPELKIVGGDKSIVSFSFAASDGWGDRQKTYWFRCKAWGKIAEWVAENVKKGDEVFISGKLTEERWEASDGGKRSAMVIIADQVQRLTPRAKQEKQEDPAQNPPEIPDDDIPFQ